MESWKLLELPNLYDHATNKIRRKEEEIKKNIYSIYIIYVFYIKILCVLGIILDLFSADPVFSECRWFLIVCRCRCQCCRFHFVFLWIFPVENPCTIIHIEPSKKIRRNLKKKTLEIATWRVKRFFIFFFLYFVLCLCQSFFFPLTPSVYAS